MSTLRIIVLLIIAFLMVRCGHTTNSVAKASTPLATTAAVTGPTKYDAPKYLSLRKNVRSNAECPRGDKTWRKLNFRQLADAANACVIDKNWQQADAIGEHLAGLSPEAPWGAFYMSVGSLALDRYPRALWMADLALKKAPRSGLLHYQKGRVLWAMSEFELAVRSKEEAIKYEPNLLDARYFLAQIYFRDREYKKSREHFEAIARLDSTSPAGFTGVAESLLAMNDKAGAIKSFEQAISLAPNDLGLRLRIGEVYEGQKMVHEALLTYKKARDIAKGERKSQASAEELSEKIQLLEKLVQESRPKVSLRSPAEDEKRSK